MPNLSKAQVTVGAPVEDMKPYIEFFSGLQVGSKVVVPLEEGEVARTVMRAFNKAAKQTGIRISRLPSGMEQIAFKIKPLEKRPVNMTEEARQARRERMASVRAARKINNPSI